MGGANTLAVSVTWTSALKKLLCIAKQSNASETWCIMGGANALAGTCDHFLNEGLPLPSLGRAPRCTVHLIAPLSHIFPLFLGFLWISWDISVCICLYSFIGRTHYTVYLITPISNFCVWFSFFNSLFVIRALYTDRWMISKHQIHSIPWVNWHQNVFQRSPL